MPSSSSNAGRWPGGSSLINTDGLSTALPRLRTETPKDKARGIAYTMHMITSWMHSGICENAHLQHRTPSSSITSQLQHLFRIPAGTLLADLPKDLHPVSRTVSGSKTDRNPRMICDKTVLPLCALVMVFLPSNNIPNMSNCAPQAALVSPNRSSLLPLPVRPRSGATVLCSDTLIAVIRAVSREGDGVMRRARPNG
ncbi:hypothetical protein BT67DRAFT_227410 [Trichocladium antarcticum]|uniref:Uncharacterized protein n=1 Tax=Trichocladium antarcticum TaxID=1450529 RepID=A0AAN6Z9W6_9PEZI|nr:hypothetical protein BT67DRAFT_227410 [Trichocladium antarcticum]